MKVNHSITPNDMTTSIEGIKMLLAGKDYGSVEPITVAGLRVEYKLDAPAEPANGEKQS